MAEQKQVWTALRERLEGIFDESTIYGEDLRILKHHVSELDGSLVIDVRMHLAGAEGEPYPWLCQIYTTLAEELEEDTMGLLAEKLGEVSFFVPFGNFGVFRAGAQVYHNYAFAANDSQEEIVSLFAFYLERILDQLSELYPLVLLLTAAPEDVDVEAVFQDMLEE